MSTNRYKYCNWKIPVIFFSTINFRPYLIVFTFTENKQKWHDMPLGFCTSCSGVHIQWQGKRAVIELEPHGNSIPFPGDVIIRSMQCAYYGIQKMASRFCFLTGGLVVMTTTVGVSSYLYPSIIKRNRQLL